MRWLILFPLLVLGACVDHRFQCKNKLAALKSVCGTSSAFCSATSLSDCVLKIRKITEAQHSQSFADFYCSEIRRYVQRHPCERRLRLAETNHASGVRLTRSPDAESIQRWRNQLRTDLHREVHTISQSNESCYHALYNNCLRHVSCRELWKIFRQLCTVDAQNQCQMTSKEDCWQSFEGISWTGLGTCTCFDDNSDCHWIRLQTNYNKCIYEIVQGHEEVEKIGSRQGAQKAKEVGSSSSQATPNNMYGTRKEYRPPSNSIQQHSTAQQQKPLSKRPGTAQNEKHFGSPTETQSPTTPPSSKPRGSPPRTHTSSQSRETFPIRPQPSNGNGNYATSHWRNQPNSFESQGSSVQGSESKESDPQRPNGHDPKSGFTGSRLDQEFFPTRAHIQIVPGAPQHGRVTLGTSSSDRRGQEASTDFRRPQGDSSSEGVQRNNDLIRVTNQDQSRMSGTQNSHRKEQVRVNQNSQRFKPTETVNNPVVSTSGHVRQMQTVSRNSGAAHTLSPTSAPIGVSVEEQRRRQHELFLMQQQERQFHEREMAAYRHRIAEEKKQREFEKAKLELGRKQQTLVRTKQKQEQEQENNGFLSPPRSFSGSHNSDFVSKHAQKPVSNSKWSTSTPRARTTSNSATISATVSESAHKFLVSSPAPSDTIFSSPLNLTMQQTSAEKKISSNRRVLQSLKNGRGNKPDWKPTDNPTSQKKKTRPTMRPPSWRLALIEDPNSSSSSVSEIVTTQTVSTNLEKPPTSPVMNSSTVGVTPSIKHVEENRNEEDNEDNDGYGGGLQFHSDVIFSKKKFQPADEDAYNDSTCNIAYTLCTDNEACKWHLSEVQMKCTLNDRCDRDSCAAAIQRFTQYVPKPLVEAMMFCHCMVSDAECIRRQQWMYPRCLYAEPQDIGPITCTEAVEKCRSEANCEHYSSLFFQLCNAEGGQCTNADLDRCRLALIEVRATYLEFPCYCVQSDLDCRRIQNGMLPNNPCVEKSMIEYSLLLEDKFLSEPFTGSPPTSTINSNEIDPATPGSPATSNKSSKPIEEDKDQLAGGSPLDAESPTNLQSESSKKTSTATTSGQKVELEIEPENKKFNESKYSLTSTANGSQKATTRVPLISYTSEELKDREPMPEGGCYTKNSVGSWILHHTDTIIRKGLEWSGRCTSWCECNFDGDLACHSLPCLSNVTCHVEETFVTFGQKLYLKDRGACTCCEDDFVCQTPKNLEPLDDGLYMFAGYSQTEVDMLKEHVPQNILERSGFVSAGHDVARDISSQLQQALERVMPLNEKCRLVLLEHYLEEHIIMHQIQWYGTNRFGNDTKAKWQTGMLEKICSPYVRKLAAVFEVSDADRYQLVLSVVKQLKVIDLLDSVPENLTPTTAIQLPIIVVALFAQIFG